eukprot:TRINITY_DN8275_c0_g1_i1.p1 TRINITY_DN8275_c0_g1~~TRINITY_DN8275_c0_g1_i1.p1  ORF type:complete len:330 (+),score=30.49 TRINITY_DN8275_c0_g1_i1:69-992(+)
MLTFGAVSVFAYFASLGLAFLIVVKDLGRRADWSSNHSKLLLGFSSAAFLVTWYHIISWMQGDMATFSTFEEWLDKSDLFVEAYKQVALSSAHWFWSSQLLTFVVPWVLFVSLCTKKEKIWIPLSYIWLGFAGAISLSLPLFLIRSQSVVRNLKLPRGGNTHIVVSVFVFISLFCVIGMPLVKDEGMYFGVLLGFLHVALFLLPVAFAKFGPPDFALLLKLVFVAVVCTHAYNTYLALGSYSVSELWHAIWSNHCQSSITIDLFFVTSITLYSICGICSPAVFAATVAGIPFFSPGGAYIYFMLSSL